MDSRVPTNEREYLNIYFRADSYSQFYLREDYDVLTYLGDIGGLLDIVLAMGWFISTVFVSRLFQAALVERVYRLQMYCLDMTGYYKTHIQGQTTPPEEKSVEKSEDSSSSSSEGLGERVNSNSDEGDGLAIKRQATNEREKLKKLITGTSHSNNLRVEKKKTGRMPRMTVGPHNFNNTLVE